MKKNIIIGHPVHHSLSPALHNHAYEIAGIADRLYFDLQEIAPDQLDDWMNTVKNSADVRGITVTIPHKSAVIKHLDWIDTTAKRIGAVNTIIRTDQGKLHGFNTDWLGILLPLGAAHSVDINGAEIAKNSASCPRFLDKKTVAIIGAGGAARSAAFATKQAGASLIIVNRTFSKAESLAIEIGAKALDFTQTQQIESADIIIQTTSVGMSPDIQVNPLSAIQFSAHHIVQEAIYTPRVTKLLQVATAAGATTIPGLEMFLYQAISQFELQTQTPAPIHHMRTKLDQLLPTTS